MTEEQRAELKAALHLIAEMALNAADKLDDRSASNRSIRREAAQLSVGCRRVVVMAESATGASE